MGERSEGCESAGGVTKSHFTTKARRAQRKSFYERGFEFFVLLAFVLCSRNLVKNSFSSVPL